MEKVVACVESAVRDFMQRQDKAHDWYHIQRVREAALFIAQKEGGDKTVIELAALAHDIGDKKIHGETEKGRIATLELLERCGVGAEMSKEVLNISMNVSFKGFDVPDTMESLEGKIVQDADRLDAIGAIAIARTFTWGGHMGRPIYDPEIPLVYAENEDEYYSDGGMTGINHFHEKLLHLKDRLHTETAKKIAEKRHEFMEKFLNQFQDEWELKDLK